MGEITIQSDCWGDQRFTECKSTLEDHLEKSFSISKGISPLSEEMLWKERPIGRLPVPVTLNNLLQLWSRNIFLPPFPFWRGWGIPAFTWWMSNISYCKITLQSKSICVDWLWAIIGPYREPGCTRGWKTLQMWISDHITFHRANQPKKPFSSIVMEWWCEVERKVCCSIKGSQVR